MIAGIWHQGSGLGNQLHRYVATRTLAETKWVPWGMHGTFKGDSFMKIDKGTEISDENVHSFSIWNEKKVVENSVDIRGYDPEINFVNDWTVIDGEFQDERYWKISQVNSWLKVEPLEMPDDLCVIGFRGGEFFQYGDLFLTEDYWLEGVRRMKEINPDMRFEIHTDDPILAQRCFPDTKVIHDIGINWRAVRYAKYAIIANSSFYIFPRLLRQNDEPLRALTIAPRYWARRNTKVWALPQNFYKAFLYI